MTAQGEPIRIFFHTHKFFHRQPPRNTLKGTHLMADRNAPNLSKWPFYLGDLLLLGIAAWIVRQSHHPVGPWPLFFLVTCAIVGAWVSVTPFLVEYRARLKFAEADSLTTAVKQLNDLRAFTNQISFATAQWQLVQEQAGNTVKTAREIGERITAEARAFSEFMQKANDAEKAHLRLETDKLRRAEQEWLQAIVRLLDHIYALHQAGLRSGQPLLIEQLGNFQSACRDAARRLGLVPFEAKPDEPFNETAHQLADPEAKPQAGASVAETIATGYTFRGQLLRPPLVSIKPSLDSTIETDAQLLFGEGR
jgi:molecular chaperone GrpE (heat shock protein)